MIIKGPYPVRNLVCSAVRKERGDSFETEYNAHSSTTEPCHPRENAHKLEKKRDLLKGARHGCLVLKGDANWWHGRKTMPKNNLRQSQGGKGKKLGLWEKGIARSGEVRELERRTPTKKGGGGRGG